MQKMLLKNLKIYQFMKNNIHYDSKYDVLNVKFSSTKNSYGDEEIDNIILLKDFKDDRITGITIMDFKKMYDRNDERMKEINKYFDFKDVFNYIESNYKSPSA